MNQRRWRQTLPVASFGALCLLLAGCPRTPMVAPSAGPSGAAGAVKVEPTISPAPPAQTLVEAAPLQDIHFEFGNAVIEPEAARILGSNVAWLKSNPRARVAIEGYADERGTPAYNHALGERRAVAARDYLVSHGIAAARLRTLSYGEERPLCTEHTETCWAKNRRVHMRLQQ